MERFGVRIRLLEVIQEPQNQAINQPPQWWPGFLHMSKIKKQCPPRRSKTLPAVFSAADGNTRIEALPWLTISTVLASWRRFGCVQYDGEVRVPTNDWRSTWCMTAHVRVSGLLPSQVRICHCLAAQAHRFHSDCHRGKSAELVAVWRTSLVLLWLGRYLSQWSPVPSE